MCARRQGEGEFGWVWDGWLRRARTFQSVASPCVRSAAAPNSIPPRRHAPPSRPSTLAAGSCAGLPSPRPHRCRLPRLQPFIPNRSAAVMTCLAALQDVAGAEVPLPLGLRLQPPFRHRPSLVWLAAGHRIFSRRCVRSSLARRIRLYPAHVRIMAQYLL